jgi:hypothetical protein
MGSAKIADCLRCDFLPENHMASTEIREQRSEVGLQRRTSSRPQAAVDKAMVVSAIL